MNKKCQSCGYVWHDAEGSLCFWCHGRIFRIQQEEGNRGEEADVKALPVKEFRELGYLQELNRQFLHPLGLALSARIEEDGTETLAEIWDCRNDPDGIHFNEVDMDKATHITSLQKARSSMIK